MSTSVMVHLESKQRATYIAQLENGKLQSMTVDPYFTVKIVSEADDLTLFLTPDQFIDLAAHLSTEAGKYLLAQHNKPEPTAQIVSDDPQERFYLRAPLTHDGMWEIFDRQDVVGGLDGLAYQTDTQAEAVAWMRRHDNLEVTA